MAFDRDRHPRFALGLTAVIGVGSIALVVSDAPLWLTATAWITATAVYECTSGSRSPAADREGDPPSAPARAPAGASAGPSTRSRQPGGTLTHVAGDRVRSGARTLARPGGSPLASGRRPRSPGPHR